MPDKPSQAKARILLVDDESPLRESLTSMLTEEGMQVTALDNGAEALDLLNRQGREYHLLISDLRMPGLDGLSLLRAVHENRLGMDVILITAYATVESAIEAIRLGATDYIIKPFLFDDLLLKIRRIFQMGDLRRENLRLRAQVDLRRPRDTIIGQSKPVQEIMGLVDKIAQTQSNVLIVGESGTGKELIARAIHQRGITAGGEFVPVNCGGIPETLFESAVFGHRRGAFTGAVRDKIGFFEAADGGTLFLDEIGNLPMSSQMSLLRAIEEKAITRVGDTRLLRVDVRIISATNVDLAGLIKENKFRSDLYFRLNVLQMRVPPLRERPEDIPSLVDHFIAKYNAEMHRSCTGISEAALNVLLGHTWRGNIRELENVIERALIFAADRRIELGDLPFGPPTGAGKAGAVGSARPGFGDLRDLPDRLDEASRIFERKHVGETLLRCGYDKNRAAETLGISLPSLYRKLHELDLPMQTHCEATQ